MGPGVVYKKSIKIPWITIWNSLSPVGANCKSHFCFSFFIMFRFSWTDFCKFSDSLTVRSKIPCTEGPQTGHKGIPMVLGNVLEIFGKFVGLFLGPLGGPWAPPGAQNGPRDPGDRFKIQKKIQKFGTEVSTIFEILIFGVLGVF